MKLRYYMRGLGIGMIVTAVLMGVATGGTKERLSDEEVMARARELGMVESTVLSNLGQKQNSESQPEESTQPVETESQPEESTQPVETESQPEESTQPVETESQPEESTQPAETESQPEAEPETSVGDREVVNDRNTGEDVTEYITFTISRGESSWTVSKNLKEEGLIGDAKAYDRFLCDNGYDHSIVTGTYKIPVGATEEEIAKIITKR